MHASLSDIVADVAANSIEAGASKVEVSVVEADGTVYPCDFFALDEWKAGRIGEQGLSEMADGETFRRFLERGREKPSECSGCRWRPLCNGGCLSDRVSGPDGDHNYYCDSFRKFFAHAEERLFRIAKSERDAALRRYR